MGLPLPPLTVTDALVPFAVIAVSMIGITIFLLGKVLPSNGRPPLVSQMTLALAVLAGGSLLLLSLLFVFLNPNGTSAWTWVLLSFNFMMMAPVGIWFIGLVVLRERRVNARGWAWPVTISLTATGSEALMGVLFVIGAEPSPGPLGSTLALGLTSVWFFWSMASVMTALIVWAPLDPTERSALVVLTAVAVVAPWVTTFPAIGGAATGMLMAVVFALLLRRLYRGAVPAAHAPFLLGLAGAFVAMAVAGTVVAALPGRDATTHVLGATMGVVMAVEIANQIRGYYHGALGLPWITRPEEDDAGSVGPPLRADGPRDGPPAELVLSGR